MGIDYHGFAFPKHVGPSPSQKADTDRKADEKALRAWRRIIWTRDLYACRCCFRRVLNVLEIRPERGECHHISPRGNAVTRHDVRNGVLVCMNCHEQIERGQIVIRQKPSQRFTLDGKTYIDANKTITFKEATL